MPKPQPIVHLWSYFVLFIIGYNLLIVTVGSHQQTNEKQRVVRIPRLMSHDLLCQNIENITSLSKHMFLFIDSLNTSSFRWRLSDIEWA